MSDPTSRTGARTILDDGVMDPAVLRRALEMSLDREGRWKPTPRAAAAIRSYVLVYRDDAMHDLHERPEPWMKRREIVDAYSAADARARADARPDYERHNYPIIDIEPFDGRRLEHREATHRDWPQPGGGAPPHLLGAP